MTLSTILLRTLRWLCMVWLFARPIPTSGSSSTNDNSSSSSDHLHATPPHHGPRRSHLLVPSRDHMVVVVVVCAPPGSMLATFFKVLLHSITLYKAPGKRVTVVAAYDPAILGQHPAALLCEEAGGRVTNVTEAFVQYLAAHRVAVDFRPIDTGNRFLDKWGRCASCKVRQREGMCCTD